MPDRALKKQKRPRQVRPDDDHEGQSVLLGDACGLTAVISIGISSRSANPTTRRSANRSASRSRNASRSRSVRIAKRLFRHAEVLRRFPYQRHSM